MGIMLAREVVTGQKQVPMRVFNPGADPVLLYKGTTIGRLIPLEEMLKRYWAIRDVMEFIQTW